MRTPLRLHSAHLVALIALSVAPSSLAQVCPPDARPLTHAPIAGPDADTIALGQFTAGTSLVDATGQPLDVRAGYESIPDGVFGTSALRIPDGPSAGVPEVGLYSAAGFDPTRGTIEMWVRPAAGWASDPSGRAYLFSLRGAKSLDGDGLNDLVVGDPVGAGGQPASHLFMGTANGVDLDGAIGFDSYRPRGMAVGDIDLDGHLDLAVAMNLGDQLPVLQQLTPHIPGELHIFWGPIVGNPSFGQADVVLEVDKAQGLLLGAFDGRPGLDVLVASFEPSTPAFYGFSYDVAGGGFDPMLPVGIGAAEALCSADFDQDGILDVVCANFSTGPSAVLYGALVGTDYTFLGASLVSSLSLGASVGDVNGDGWTDVVLAQTLDDQVVIHLNDGAGGFDPVPDCILPTPNPFTVSAEKDLDHDGAIDIVVANWREGLPPTNLVSRAYLGPFPSSGGGPPVVCDPPQIQYQVTDAVSMTLGDVDGDGIDDLFFHSGTAHESSLFLLDVDGRSKAGEVGPPGAEVQLPSQLVPTEPTFGKGQGGEGAGVYAAVTGGTTAYGTSLSAANTFELWAEDGEIHFAVTDDDDVSHVVSAPLPGASHPDAVNRYHHVQAEWDGALGLVQLRIGHPGNPANVHTEHGPAFAVDRVGPVLRLGSDTEGQRRAKGWKLDDVRVSRVRRSGIDADADRDPDEWDNCPATFDPSQADFDDDGIGDACMSCQADLGCGTPGGPTLTVCGEPMASCDRTTMLLRGAPANAVCLLMASVAPSPGAVPFRGGCLVVDLPTPFVLPLTANKDGEVRLELPGGGGPVGLVLQFAVSDGAQTKIDAISNGIQADWLP